MGPLVLPAPLGQAPQAQQGLVAPPAQAVGLQAPQALQARLAVLLALQALLALGLLGQQEQGPRGLLVMLALLGLREAALQLCPLAQLATPSLATAQRRLLSRALRKLERVQSPALGRLKLLMLLA